MTERLPFGTSKGLCIAWGQSDNLRQLISLITFYQQVIDNTPNMR